MPSQDQKNQSSKLPQIIAALSACIGSFALGTVVAWTSPAQPFLSNCQTNASMETTEDAPKYCDLSESLDDNEFSLVGSLFPVGALVSGQVTGLLMSILGRKLTMISMSIPCTIGWILLMIPKYSDSGYPGLFYAGRFLTGFGTGAFTLAVPSYVSEIAERSIQGALASCMQLSCTLGILFVSGLAIENAVHWDIITGICIAFPVLMSVAMFFMPESPYFLITKGNVDGAEKSLSWLRGSGYDIKHEMDELQATYQEQTKTGSVSVKQIFTNGVYVKPFLMALALMLFQQFSGINAVLFYLQEIFTATGSDMDTGLSAFIICLVQVIATAVAVMVVDRFGRRILLVLSAAFMCVSLVGLGVFFYMKENECIVGNMTRTETPLCEGDHEGYFTNETVENVGWLPLVSLIIYIFFFSIGFGPLAWSINAEIFPREAKSLGSSLATSFNWFCAFLVAQFQTNLIEAIHKFGVYFLYASVCAAAVAFVVLILPETKGKSPEEMKLYFSGGRRHAEAGKGEDNRAFQNS